MDKVVIDSTNIFTPDGTMPQDEIYEFCREYEQRIAGFGGLDIVFLGIGRVGNIAFNEPGSRMSPTPRLILLDSASRNEASTTFGTIDCTPISSITMWVATFLSSIKCFLMALCGVNATLI